MNLIVTEKTPPFNLCFFLSRLHTCRRDANSHVAFLLDGEQDSAGPAGRGRDCAQKISARLFGRGAGRGAVLAGGLKLRAGTPKD